jgi:very-short-patch-repair endonuclease
MGQGDIQSAAIWALVARQHGVVSRRQLLELGLNDDAIWHRRAKGRLHVVRRGVYAAGRPEITRTGELMAAVLLCSEGAVLSHRSAGELFGITAKLIDPIDVTIPAAARNRHDGLRVHRRDLAPTERTTHLGIPLTAPVCTLVDLATVLTPAQLEAAINEADKLDVIDPESLRMALESAPRRAGIGTLRAALDQATFRLTDSELERRFLPQARSAGLGTPLTQQWIVGYRVDFYWPNLGLVVECDGLRYHRTAAAQARDRSRDQALTAAGLTVLRFTHGQVRYEGACVKSRLAVTAARLRELRKVV